MNSMEKLSRQIAKATRGNKTKPYDTKGVVKSVKGGVAMVHFYGGVDETPVEMSINATVGDEVYVRSSGGRAFIVGNNSKPPTDDSMAILARLKALVAERSALLAHQVADRAMGTAQEASTTATEAKGIAETADGKADDAVEAVSTTIESDTIHYLATSYSSGVTTADSPSTYGTWTTTVQTIDSTKRYLWTYHTYHKVSGQSINTTPVITGVYGQTGASVTGITEYYAVSATNEPPADSAFTPNVIQPTASTPYLWNMEMVSYSDGNSRFMGKHILMTYNQGTEGRGIASVVEYYARNNSTTAPADSDFGTSVVLPTAQYKYVWNYEVINYTDGINPTKTDKRIIGTYGEKGDSPTITTTKNGKTTTIYADGTSIGTILDGLDGDMPTVSKSGDTVTIVDGAGNTVTVKDGQDGQSIKGDDGTPAYLHIAWANSADGTVDFSTVDAVGKQYMGTYTDSTVADSQSPTSYKWLKVKGERGLQGIAGDDGVGITAVQPQYYLSTSPSTTMGGSWSNTLTYETDKYIWTRDMIYYDDETYAPSTAIYNQALTEAFSKSEGALALAEGIEEHFWHDDSTGAHITQVTQAEYEADPDNAGGNLLMTSQGMAVRDGRTELATFTGNGAQMGKNNQWHVNVLSNALEFNPPTGSNAETIKILTGGNDYGQLLFSYTDSGYLYETYLCNGELYILRYNQSSQVDEYISLTADGLLLNDGGTNSTYITPTSASIGGHPSGLYTEDVLIVDGLTVEHGNYNTTNKSVAKTGYTPIGIVGMHLANATTGGTYNTFVFPHSWYLSGTTAYFTLRNTHASTDAKIKITATILYARV